MARRGYTLIELVAASALTGTVLVAAMSLLRQAVDLSDRIDRQNLIETLCVSKLEESINTVAVGFATSDTSGNFSSQGFSSYRYRVICTDAPASGGITSKLMAVTCLVYYDENGDSALTTGEQSVTLATKVAKMALYVTEAGG
jgi:prepilin-type N-terminal cleavage/methylation domain-containing protein